MAGSLFASSHISLQLWFYAILHYANSPESLSSTFLARQLGVSAPTAIRVASQIRLHLAVLDEGQLLGRKDRPVCVRLVKLLRVVNKTKGSQNSVQILLMSDGSRVEATPVIYPRAQNLRPHISAKVVIGSRIITDCFWTFRTLTNYGGQKSWLEFDPDHYATSHASENMNHGYFQYLNLSFADTFRGVALDNIWLYLKEYEFRYNRRNRSAETFWDMVSQFPRLDTASIERVKQASFIARGNGSGR